MTSRDRMMALCAKSMEDLGLKDEKYQLRFAKELREIDNQSEHDYLIGLHDRKHYYVNENNLLIPHLLGLCATPNIDADPKYVFGEFPDIDTDFLKDVQIYLKNIWASATFGFENVSAICNYTTFGLKSSLIDMARIFGKDRKEILDITTKLGSKDDEGDQLTFEKAVELFPKFKEYCENNKDVAEATQRILGRNRGMGVHAGGLIIANQRLDNIVPLVKGEDKDGNPISVSSFVEGLHGTDLGPLGLIKFDMLVVNDLKRIADCCELIKQRYGMKSICALPGQDDWSDIAYLNDKKCLEAAGRGELKGVFQFDSDGIREMCRKGGVDSFNDMIAYNSLYRPGPLGADMEKVYINRKKGNEEYEIHPLLQPILGKTYGVLVYQEQVMRVLNVVGSIPLIFCEKIRKAISKKKVKDFMQYKAMFLENGKTNLGWDDAAVEELWGLLEKFSEYGFNASHSCAYCYIAARTLYLKTHYPLEFFTSTLRCEGESDKIKVYKREAQRLQCPVKKLCLQNSKFTFDIVDKDIYIGFSNIKGIGEDVGRRIEAGKPYASFEDFLNKFGTDACVLKPLIALNVFEGDRKQLFGFYQHYKDAMKKREDRDKRSAKSIQTVIDEFRATLPESKKEQAEEILKELAGMSEVDGTDKAVKLGPDCLKPYRKYCKALLSIKKKQDEDAPLKFSDYVYTAPDLASDKLDAATIKYHQILDGLPSAAEEAYYGFSWVHEMEYCPDYDGGRNFEQFNDENTVTALVECVVKTACQQKMSKKGNPYYTIGVEDENNKFTTVTIWEEDYARFKEEFEYWDHAKGRGHFLKIRLEKPNNGFRSYGFDSPPKALRKKIIPQEKSQDYRLTVMQEPELKKG